jgi:AraC-like DNA-binding protein
MNPQTFYRYLPASAADKIWGLIVPTAGYSWIPAKCPYPPGKHPHEYTFHWKKGRILQEFQLVYITRGRGTFESEATGTVPVSAGDAFLLFPGVWHRYLPDPKTGWDEYWIGFDGDTPRRLLSQNVFSPKSPMFSLGLNGELEKLFSQIFVTLRLEAIGYRQVLAGFAFTMLAHLQAVELGQSICGTVDEAVVQKARLLVVERLFEAIDWPKMAQELRVSYSLLRHAFKQHTGFSPHQYQLQLRLEKAKTLLSGTSYSVKEIATTTGFNCPYHFSTLFKRKLGISPLAWRHNGTGEKLKSHSQAARKK